MRKIFNDPVYGFVSIRSPLVLALIDHPYFQRLRRIAQLGLTHYVYPGALHTRFHHALGAMHLMNEAIEVLRMKGHAITEREAEAATIAILLHDIGHGPYSHTLENCLVTTLSHEVLSEIFMNRLNEEFDGKLSLALNIFKGEYKKRFLSQLISGQLDVDRMDYLNRDSFFTGVYEGVIGYDRIIKMLEVHEGNLVVEAKGIYSIEKFIIARRLMYWQVYLHKTVICAEQMLVKIFERARELASSGIELPATEALRFFLYHPVSEADFQHSNRALEYFANLDDFDIFSAIKSWCYFPDFVLSELCKRLVNRRLFRIILQNEAIPFELVDRKRKEVAIRYNIPEEDTGYFVFSGSTSNSAYDPEAKGINLLFKDGTIHDISIASDQLNISVLSKPVVKNYLCYPKELD